MVCVLSAFLGQRLSEADPIWRPANPLLLEFLTNAASWPAVIAAIAAFWLIGFWGLVSVVLAFVIISNVGIRMRGTPKPSTAIYASLSGIALLLFSSSKVW